MINVNGDCRSDRQKELYINPRNRNIFILFLFWRYAIWNCTLDCTLEEGNYMIAVSSYSQVSHT